MQYKNKTDKLQVTIRLTDRWRSLSIHSCNSRRRWRTTRLKPTGATEISHHLTI